MRCSGRASFFKDSLPPPPHQNHLVLRSGEAPVDDIWMRDIAPMYVANEADVLPFDLNFNGWGPVGCGRSGQGIGWLAQRGISLVEK
ncbi:MULTISPECIES: agmatine deiminase family protein [Bradyrhizobium]|uniref:agmatine deiminase family protein n=1 Tax=Bradyrhizobium japonicum TaxID=375 RepID=UPI002226B051|nr:agmatine deiminase family protein [Bradyrhizobium japonicum]